MGNQCFYLFDSHNKDEIGRMSAIGTAVLRKFDSLQGYEFAEVLGITGTTQWLSTSKYKVRMHWEYKKHNWKCIEKWGKENIIIKKKKY